MGSNDRRPGWDEWDWRDERTQLVARTALAKYGVDLNDDGSRGSLLRARNDMRRVVSSIQQEARARHDADKNMDPKEFQRFVDEIDAIAAMVKRVDGLISAHDSSEMVARGGVGGEWSRDGKQVPVLGRTDSFAKAVKAERMSSNASFGFGDYVAAMVRGTDNMAIRAALSEGTDSAGGYTVPTFLLADVIDRMRAKTVCIQAGARTIPLETKKTSIARIASDPTAAWRLENGAINVSDPTFEKVEFNAKSLAVLVKVSRELLDDSVNINDALMMAFAGSMAAETDRVCLFGSGVDPEPLGINGTTNVGVQSMGTNGAALTGWGKVLDTILEIKQDNGADPTAMVMSPRTWRTIEGFVDTTGQPLQAPRAVAAIPSMVSTNVLNTMTQGTANNASAIVVGDFTQMMLGIRTELRIEVLRELFAANHQYAFVAHLRFDVQLAHPESFAVLRGIIP